MEFRYDQDIFASLWKIQWLAMTEELGIPADSLAIPELPPLETMSVTGKGTFSISDDGTEFTLSDMEEEVLINGKPHIDFFTDVGKVLVRFMALVLGISEEDYPAFEKEALAEFLHRGRKRLAAKCLDGPRNSNDEIPHRRRHPVPD